MLVPRTLYLVIGAIAAPVGVCASVIAPAVGVLAGTIAVGLVMLLGAAGALLAADWQADQQSRQAWAEIAPALAEWNAIDREEAEDIETRCRPALADDVLREVFRLHRFRAPQVPAMELSIAPSAFPAVPALSLPKGTTCRAPQVSQPDGESDAGALVRNDLTDQTTLGAVGARPAKMTAVVGRRSAASNSAAGGSRVRLAVNAGWNWLASDRALATPRHDAEVVVLSKRRDAQHTRPVEAATETVCATGAEPPHCRGPPSREQRRLARRVATPVGHVAPAPNAPDGALIVLDDLGQPVPVCAAEVNVIETYLCDDLEELFASSKARSDPEQA